MKRIVKVSSRLNLPKSRSRYRVFVKLSRARGDVSALRTSTKEKNFGSGDFDLCVHSGQIRSSKARIPRQERSGLPPVPDPPPIILAANLNAHRWFQWHPTKATARTGRTSRIAQASFIASRFRRHCPSVSNGFRTLFRRLEQRLELPSLTTRKECAGSCPEFLIGPASLDVADVMRALGKPSAKSLELA